MGVALIEYEYEYKCLKSSLSERSYEEMSENAGSF